jgi:hypothetical protein
VERTRGWERVICQFHPQLSHHAVTSSFAMLFPPTPKSRAQRVENYKKTAVANMKANEADGGFFGGVGVKRERRMVHVCASDLFGS